MHIDYTLPNRQLTVDWPQFILPTMNWQSALVVAAIFITLILAVLRSEPRIRIWIFLLLILPGGVLSIRWAAFRDAWLEFAVGSGIGLLFVVLWWRIIGRKLPPPTGSQVRVWTEDDPF
jgi:hypothetical protein